MEELLCSGRRRAACLAQVQTLAAAHSLNPEVNVGVRPGSRAAKFLH